MASSTGAPDELYTLRNLFWLGNYQLAINEANSLNRLPKSLIATKEEFVYRSYIGLGQYDIVINEVKESNPSSDLKSLRILAQYLAKKLPLSDALSKLDEFHNDALRSSSGTFFYVLATLHVYGDNVKDALVTTESHNSIELSALAIQLMLRIDRPDLAQQRLSSLKQRDDGVLSQLASAWVNIRTGGVKGSTDASFVYDELIEKYGASLLLLNGNAVAKMSAGQFQEAETHLQDALNKDASDPDTLANIITVSYHLDKPQEVINRYLSQLRTKAPSHPLIVSLGHFESAYDRVSESLSIR